MSVQITEETANVEAAKPVTAATNANPPGEGATQTELEDSGWDEKTKNYIKSLRTEAAKNRTKAKELEAQFNAINSKFSALESGLKKSLGVEGTEELQPEAKISELAATNENMAFRNAVLETAVGHGIGADQLEMLEFLILKRADALEEGQELTDEDMAEIVSKVKLTSKAMGSSTSVTSSVQAADSNTQKALSVESFAKMSIAEKSLLFSKDPNTYNTLMAAAREKRLLGR
jgi:hypothetical protein